MGGGFVKNEFEAFLSKHGIQHQKTIPYTPQQNGVAERTNRTLVEMDTLEETWGLKWAL